MTLRVFPVAGGAQYSDDWAAARSGGRSHQGNDLFAPSGTPLLAVDDGAVRFAVDPLGGNAAYLKATDGTTYYYAHLSAFAGSARAVRAGEVIGFVGNTGNAATTPSHCHFEVHPGGGAAVDPYPLLRAATVLGAPSGSNGLTVGKVVLSAAMGAGLWYGLGMLQRTRAR